MLSVVLYHLWPHRITGGYVGVDIFFVISGYLITGHLLRELDETGGIRLARFWSRRIRRLLPASLLVLVSSIAFVFLIMPVLAWQQNLGEIRAAGAYFENWYLAASSIDYLGAANSPSLVQHFWSLSTEEQFYIAQPVLLLGATLLARRRRIVVPLLSGAVLLSLVYSVVLTATQPGVAYFSTGTRAWEFAVGGLVAASPMARLVPTKCMPVLVCAGLALIGFAVFTYDGSTPFPGWTAGVPVLGTAAVLVAAGDRAAWSPARVLELRPLTLLGDWSYSIYLWHWPLMIGLSAVLARDIGWKLRVAVLLVTILIAALTKRYVEDRWRRSTAQRAVLRSYLGMAVAVAAVIAVTTGGSWWAQARTAAEVSDTKAALAAVPARCVGAAAVVNACGAPYAPTSTTVPAVAADDVPWNRGIAASKPCPGQSNTADPVAHACVFNNPSRPSETIALIGDSHADHFIDAVNAAAERRHWRLITYTREGCSSIPSAAEPDAKCQEWSERVQATLLKRGDIDAVMVSTFASAEAWTPADADRAWRTLGRAGIQVIPIIDVPGMRTRGSAPTCVANALTEYDPCSTRPPPVGKTAQAAAALGLQAISVNDVLCGGGRCHSVIGGLIVYMDEAHLTLSFSYSLREVLGERIERVIDESK